MFSLARAFPSDAARQDATPNRQFQVPRSRYQVVKATAFQLEIWNLKTWNESDPGLYLPLSRGRSVNSDRLAAHLSTNRYGDFTLTDAVRPGPSLSVRPREGFRVDVYRDRRAKVRMPML